MRKKIAVFDFEEIEQNNLRNEYYNSGALIIRNLLAEKEIEIIFQFLQKLLKLKYPNLHDGPDFGTSMSVSNQLMQAISIDSDAQRVIYDVMAKSAATHTVSTNSKILNVIKILLSDTFTLHEKKLLLMSTPHETWHLAKWHQDFYYNGGSENACTVYVPLQKTDLSNGGLSIALGSHMYGQLAHDSKHSNNKWNTISKDDVETFTNICNIEMDKGDVLFLHSLVPHTANINKSDQVRLVANFRYQDLSNKAFIDDNWSIGDLSKARDALSRKND